jgi:hypothetical protein
MSSERSKRLKIGQRAAWRDSAADQGTVTASDALGCASHGIMAKTNFFRHNNMTEVEVAISNLQ